MRQSNDQITQKLHDIIKEALPELEYSETSLLGKSAAPSLDRVILATEIEAKFKIRFAIEEIGSSDFERMDKLTGLVRKKAAHAQRIG